MSAGQDGEVRPGGLTVGDLRGWLAQFPDELEVDVIITRRTPFGVSSLKTRLNVTHPNPMGGAVNLEGRVGLA